MAYDPKFKMSIQNKADNYYSATINADGSWNIATATTTTYLQSLPDGWDKQAIEFERDPYALGIFRSSTSEQGNFIFALDGRAIILDIARREGIRGYGLLTIYCIDPAGNGFTYTTYYKSELDFKGIGNGYQEYLTSIGTLDSGLKRDKEAYEDTVFHMPIWDYDATDGWTTGAACILHDGLKLLYNSTYVSGATGDTPGTAILYRLFGFNHGRHTTSGPGMGCHTVLNLTQYAPVQNNGATTFIGNTILQPFLIQGSQESGVDTVNELNFLGATESRPYPSNNSLFVNYPDNTVTIDMSVAVSGSFISAGVLDYNDNGNGCFVGFGLFEIDSANMPVTDLAGNYQYQLIYKLDLPPSGGGGYIPPSLDFSTYDAPISVTLKNKRAYVICVIFDEPAAFGGLSGNGTRVCDTGWSQLQFSILSRYDSGASGVPVAGPKFPASAFFGFRLHQILEKLVPYLATTNTDGYGFPVPAATPYRGVSNFLSNPSLPATGDIVPWQIIISSAYCIHDLSGRSYISISLKQLFDFCKKRIGCGMSIESDLSGEQNILRIEDLGYFLNASNMILDLGSDIFGFESSFLVNNLGCNLKLGYTQQDLNSNFGTDLINGELFFNTPLSNIPGTMDYEESGILTEIYAIELTRSQQVSQPIGTTNTPDGQSDDGNQAIALYCLPSSTQFLPGTVGGNPDYPNVIVTDPQSTPVPVFAFQLTQRNGINLPAAQSADPTAAVAPYIYGTKYPDSVYNIELSPCRALQCPTGAFLHSVLDHMDSESLTFRNTSVMQYNNEALALSGIESNLVVGGGNPVTTEFKDVLIGSLPPQLFKPIVYKFKSKYPANMYQILQTNPNGYIRFLVRNEAGYGYTEKKMFLMKATQVANGSVTEFEGWATPDMVI